MKKFNLNQPDGTPAQVTATNKTQAFKKFTEWFGGRFEFSKKDVYLVNF